MSVVRYFGTAKGRVQGVGFRFFTEAQAEDLGITGWVRNMSDGSVTMELQGEQEAVDEMAKRIEAGNHFINVKSFTLEEREVLPEEKGFVIRH